MREHNKAERWSSRKHNGLRTQNDSARSARWRGNASIKGLHTTAANYRTPTPVLVCLHMLTFGALSDVASSSLRNAVLALTCAAHFHSFISPPPTPLLIDGQCPQTVHFSSRVPTQKGRIDFYIPMEKVRPFNLAGHADGVPWLLGATLGSRLSSQLESLEIQAASGGGGGGIKRVAGAA